jgi:hypothetical protein
MATVRPETDNLVAVLTAAAILGREQAAQEFQVVQLPHTPRQVWAALARPAPPAEPLLALLLVGQVNLAAPLAGLFCDGWSDVIPSETEITGLTFHYDAPGARPPQMVLLAVPPDLGQETWNFDALVETVVETFHLAKLRAVGPQEIPVLGGSMLPPIYLLRDTSLQLPSIDFERIRAWLDNSEDRVLGKVYRNDF